MTIQLLDEQTINKIAAGEVIDRPASILKELVDNSLDAGSSRIEITLEQGGIRHLKVTDNGCGMSVDDLVKAPLRHATSKITSLDDIYNTASLGFRGEALASISHIASLRIQTRPHDEDSATEITAEEGVLSSPKPVSHRPGTTVDVHDVFYRIPVRRQYLKSSGTEYSHCYQTLLPFVFFFPHVDFVLIHNDEEVLSTVGCSDVSSLLQQVFGSSLRGKLIAIDHEYRGITVKGWMSSPALTFPNRTKQYYAVNSRIVKSAILQKIVSDVYRDLIPARRFPLLVLNVGVEFSAIDVNIHPKKTDVKFLHSGHLFSSVSKMCKQVFGQVHSVMDPSHVDPLRSVGGATTLSATAGSSFFNPGVTEDAPPLVQNSLSLFETTDMDHLEENFFEFFQIFDTYLVVKAKAALWVLDQHAVHERILYERFKAQLADGTDMLSPLLLGEVVEVSPDLMAVFHDVDVRLRELSFHIEVFGKDQLIIRQVPLQFSGCNIKEWLLFILDEFKSLGRLEETLDLKDELQLKACKAAIKAGKRLPESEVKQLLSDFMASPSNFTCPHGRPLFLSFSKKDLECLFLRR